MLTTKFPFSCDYMEGAHPHILSRLVETNMMHTPGYGLDPICESAKARIRKACDAKDAEVEFLIGGTQTNATVIAALLRSYEGVIAADSGHVNVHEAGAIEYTGHKVLALPSKEGKLSATAIDDYVKTFYADDNCDHMVAPGMVYISQPTEWGTLYTLEELTAISSVCRAHHMPLFVDGARLSYALGSSQNDVTLPDLSRLADVFYIGGTKCGALLGEAVVVPDPALIPHFFTIIKQHGALLAKGRLLGIQFDELFKDDLYFQIGKDADRYAEEIQKALTEKGIPLYFESPTNQVFFTMDNETIQKLAEKVSYGFGCAADETHSVIRLCTHWATTEEDTKAVCDIIRNL